MCYSALIRADYATLVREFGAVLSLEEFAALYAYAPGGKRPKTPKAMDDGFAGARTERGRDIMACIQQWHAQEQQALQAELAQQEERQRIAAATLATRPTQKARNDLRVAGNRLTRAQARLDDLHRVQLLPRDNRIFPGTYAPVMVSEHGQRVIKPMRYQCRLPDTPARHDVLYPGTYNARRDSLEGYWRGAFGHRHGVVVVQAFYEHVQRPAPAGTVDAADGRDTRTVLEFRPDPQRDLLLACLWAEWEGPEGRLLSFAAITDTPPADVAAAGHDRGIIPIRPEHLDAWLNPDPGDLAAQYRILDDREAIRYTWDESI
ncbi:SOS response-associated peptidase family protein [Stenotrophomonas sp. 24(2023)]|uniref:SOS response-associated peptidase family protein n=1 Tax=Stenotrophomonas sp. 24(2023) TaxID=3068324 RepID=UPI0027DFE352|nr:SOS response-associated peptidase family protein [Stenotrophomonas sp. 24(2023)]WMJ69595.1 SOS response-associated peptidase family protein [Stenotrophomonas sp. 24(2023)]